MPFTPTAGPVAVLKMKSGGLATQATFPAINWKLDIDPKLKDVSNFATGRTRAKTLQDATLSFTLVYDNTTNPFLAANGGLTDGAVVAAECFSDGTNFFAVPCMISKVGAEVEGLEGVLMCQMEASLHLGSVTYPIA